MGKKSKSRKPENKSRKQHDDQGDPCTQELSKLWEAYKPAREDDLQGCSSFARALWSTLPKHSRNDLLTIKVYDIMQHAWLVSQDDLQGRGSPASLSHQKRPLLEFVESTIQKLRADVELKSWHWPDNKQECPDAASFRKFFHEECIPHDLKEVLQLVPANGRLPGSNLRQRMTKLLEQLCQERRDLLQLLHKQRGHEAVLSKCSQSEWPGCSSCHFGHEAADLANILSIMNGLLQESDNLFMCMMRPVLSFLAAIHGKLHSSQGGKGETGYLDINYDHIDSLSAPMASHVCEWMIEIVKELALEIKTSARSPKKECRQNWCAFKNDSEQGECLQVAARCLDTVKAWIPEDIQNQTAKEAWKALTGGGPCSVPVWVYSDPGRSRERAMRALCADLGRSEDTFIDLKYMLELLEKALEEQKAWRTQLDGDNEEMAFMLHTNRTLADMRRMFPDMYNVDAIPASYDSDYHGRYSLSDRAIACLISREQTATMMVARTAANNGNLLKKGIQDLQNKAAQASLQRRTLQTDDHPLQNIRVNRLPGGQSLSELKGTVLFPSAEVVNLRHINADALVAYWKKELLKLEEQSRAFLASGQRLERLVRIFQVPQTDQDMMIRLRRQFFEDIRPQMMTLDTDYWKTSTRDFEPGIEALKNKIKVGWAVIQEIEKQIVKAACQDSGLKLGQHIVFPLLNKRVESEAHMLDVDRAADTDGTMKAESKSGVRQERACSSQKGTISMKQKPIVDDNLSSRLSPSRGLKESRSSALPPDESSWEGLRNDDRRRIKQSAQKKKAVDRTAQRVQAASPIPANPSKKEQNRSVGRENMQLSGNGVDLDQADQHSAAVKGNAGIPKTSPPVGYGRPARPVPPSLEIVLAELSAKAQ